MVSLNATETSAYRDKISRVIPTLKPGIYMFRDFFVGGPTCPRLARKLYEDVVSGNIYRNFTLVGSYSREGYIVH